MGSLRASIGTYVGLIRAEFRESSGLRLTKGEIERLWRLDEATARAVLDALVEARILRRTSDGTYVRADCGDEVPAERALPRRSRPFPRE